MSCDKKGVYEILNVKYSYIIFIISLAKQLLWMITTFTLDSS